MLHAFDKMARFRSFWAFATVLILTIHAASAAKTIELSTTIAHKPPVAKHVCGIRCIPSACKATQCPVVPEAKCQNDNCSCTATFFLNKNVTTEEDEKVTYFVDVTMFCNSPFLWKELFQNETLRLKAAYAEQYWLRFDGKLLSMDDQIRLNLLKIRAVEDEPTVTAAVRVHKSYAAPTTRLTTSTLASTIASSTVSSTTISSTVLSTQVPDTTRKNLENTSYTWTLPPTNGVVIPLNVPAKTLPIISTIAPQTTNKKPETSSTSVAPDSIPSESTAHEPATLDTENDVSSLTDTSIENPDDEDAVANSTETATNVSNDAAFNSTGSPMTEEQLSLTSDDENRPKWAGNNVTHHDAETVITVPTKSKVNMNLKITIPANLPIASFSGSPGVKMPQHGSGWGAPAVNRVPYQPQAASQGWGSQGALMGFGFPSQSFPMGGFGAMSPFSMGMMGQPGSVQPSPFSQQNAGWGSHGPVGSQPELTDEPSEGPGNSGQGSPPILAWNPQSMAFGLRGQGTPWGSSEGSNDMNEQGQGMENPNVVSPFQRGMEDGMNAIQSRSSNIPASGQTRWMQPSSLNEKVDKDAGSVLKYSARFPSSGNAIRGPINGPTEAMAGVGSGMEGLMGLQGLQGLLGSGSSPYGSYGQSSPSQFSDLGARSAPVNGPMVIQNTPETAKPMQEILKQVQTLMSMMHPEQLIPAVPSTESRGQGVISDPVVSEEASADDVQNQGGPTSGKPQDVTESSAAVGSTKTPTDCKNKCSKSSNREICFRTCAHTAPNTNGASSFFQWNGTF